MKAPASHTATDFDGPNWRWFVAAGLLAIALVSPFFLIDVPPVLDYPNHLARYFVLAHPDDPILSRMYAPHWAILPNLGMDVIGAAMLRVIDVHTGGRILLALSLLSPVIGVIAYHRAVFGAYRYWPLGSGLLAYNGAFFLGFMNFLLSLGVALIASAGWIALRRRKLLLAPIAIGAVAAAVIFFCHIFGVILFALLIAADEASSLWEGLNSGTLRAKAVACSIGAVAAALSPALLLYLLSPLNAGAASVGEWQGLAKLWRIWTPFMTSSAELTLITGIAVVSLLILHRRQLQFAPGLSLALASLLVAFVAAPSSLKGGTFVDLRFALMIGLLLFAGIQPHLAGRQAVLTAAVLGTLIVFRSAYVGVTWIDHRHDLADLRAAMAKVEPGTRVLAARGRPGHVMDAGPAARALPGVYRLDGNLAALLVIERHAFWPLLFADPAQQPLTVKPPFDQLAQQSSESIEWYWLTQKALLAEVLRRARYLEHWQQNFDYVLLVDPPAMLQSTPALSPLYRGNYAQLYRVSHEADRD